MVFEGAQTAPPFKSRDQLRLNPTHRSEISYQRWLDKRIHKTGCFGQLGLQRKQTPNCHKYATFLGGFFNFLWAKKNLFKDIVGSAIKSYMI